MFQSVSSVSSRRIQLENLGKRSPKGFHGLLSELGDAGCGPCGLQVQQKTGQLYIQIQRSTGGSDLCFSSPETSSLSALQKLDGEHTIDPNYSGLSQVNVLHQPGKTSSRYTVSPARSSRSIAPSADLPSCFTVAGFDGIAIEF